jgi:Protein of unknown function (DUF3300)
MKHHTKAPTHTRLRHTVAMLLAGTLVLSGLQAGCATQRARADEQPVDYGAPADPQPPPGTASSAPQTPEQLDQLVAPIALYPDELVAQVLAAATYPAEIVEANRWLQQHSDLKGDALGKEADSQPWDDSVKALVQFPSVLTMMDKNLSWTSSLGQAYASDSQAVTNAVQQMRARAQQAGNLTSTPQESVTNQGDTIVIEPAQPEMVYVPEYDPWLVYGDPIEFYPGWVPVPGLFVGGPGIVFGFGVGIGVFGGFGWGWHHWGADWHGHGIEFDHHHWDSHSPSFEHHGGDWRHAGNGFHPGPGGYHPGPGGYHPGAGGYHPGAGGYHPGFAGGSHPGGFRPEGAGGFHPGGVAPGGGHPGGFGGGTHSSAFSGFNHGGVTGGFSARGQASAGGFHGGGGGGFHGGGGGHR